MLGILLVAGTDIRAEIMVGKSLEGLTDQSSAIGTYVVTAVTTNPAGDTFSCQLRLQHSDKGDCPETAKDEYFKSKKD
jgi:hypothetical protein